MDLSDVEKAWTIRGPFQSKQVLLEMVSHKNEVVM